MTCPTCHGPAEKLLCGPSTKPYLVWFCPTCDARVEPVPDTPAPADYPRSSSDRTEADQ